jgi:hypothetical protein
MASNTQPIYPKAVIGAELSIATANTGRDGTGTIGTLYTAVAAASGGQGAIVQSITCCATGTTTAGVIRMWRKVSSTYTLMREFLVTAITPGVATEVWKFTTAQGADSMGRIAVNVMLEPGDVIAFSTHIAETFNITADIGEY